MTKARVCIRCQARAGRALLHVRHPQPEQAVRKSKSPLRGHSSKLELRYATCGCMSDICKLVSAPVTAFGLDVISCNATPVVLGENRQLDAAAPVSICVHTRSVTSLAVPDEVSVQQRGSTHTHTQGMHALTHQHHPALHSYALGAAAKQGS